MIKYAYVLVLFLIISTGIFAQPKLYIVGGDTVSWGRVRVDQSPVTNKLILINKGNELLIFKRVNPTCGCTTAPLDKSELRPGDTATIDITFNLPNHNGIAHKAITIVTNDPDKNIRTVQLIADVYFPLVFFPTQQFTFPGLLVGDTILTRVVVTNTTDEDIVLKEIKISPDIAFTNIKDNDVIKSKQDLSIDVTSIPKTPGVFTGELQFKTTHPDVVRVKIPIVINVQGVRPAPEKPMKY